MSDKYDGRYPTAWSKRDLSLYQQFGREPAKTSNGLWVGDVEREAKPLNEWSVAELFAFASGELDTEHVVGSTDFYVAVRSKAILEDTEAMRWGEEDLDNWLLFEKTPEKTPNGNYINDPDRWIKDAAVWNDSELVDLGMGYFGELERHQYYILDEASTRFELPVGITFEDYCQYIQKNTYPELFNGTVLVNDRNRSEKAVSDWTDDELQAWVVGSIVSDRPELFKTSIERFGGEWYWGIAELKHWVTTGDIPAFVHDYSSYTDEQLKLLIADGDTEAELQYEVRHPPVEVVIYEHPQEPEATVDTEVESPVQEDAEPDDLVEPDPETEVETPVDEVDPGTSEEPAPVVEVTVIEEGSALAIAVGSETSFVAMENVEHRTFLAAKDWTAEELVGWARGLIPMGMNVTHSSLVAAIRTLCTDVVDNWTDVAVVDYIVSKKLPEGFDKGILVHDRKRDNFHPADWSDDLLKAWARGEIITTWTKDIILLSARIRFRVPDRHNDEQAIDFVANGTVPDEGLKDVVNIHYADADDLIGILKGDILATQFTTDEVMSAVRVKFAINPHWTNDHIYNYYRNGISPLLTTTGVFVEDRLRNLDSPANWTWDELKALVLDETHANFLPTDDECISRLRRLISLQFNVSAVHWSADDVIEYVKSSLKPLALEDGVYLNDPVRPDKDASEWRDAELRAWLQGKILATEKANDEDLWDEVYIRFKVPVFWYREDAKVFVLNGVRVPSTPSGIYIRDRNRDYRKVEHWTRREVKAWARGQILPGINCDETILANRAARMFSISTHLDTASIKKRISDIREESMTMTVKFVSEDLKSYVKGRDEAGDNAVKAAPYQTLLDRCINRVVRLEGEDFVQGWTELLNFFQENSKGICSPKKIYCGVGQMAITGKGLRNFQNLTSVLQSTANPETRDKAIKLIDWPVALKEVANEKSRQSILAYYGIV